MTRFIPPLFNQVHIRSKKGGMMKKTKFINKHNFPQLTQEPIRFVDGAPDDGYVLRILRAYRENCNCNFVAEPPSELIDALNEGNKKRMKLLDNAIDVLLSSVQFKTL